MLQTTRYLETLNWYLEHLGLIVSDFQYYQGQRERGPTMSFIRCDRGVDPDRPPHPGDGARARATATCTRPTRWATSTRWPPAGSTCASRAIHRSWGIGRHIQGSQIFDYWRDPDGFLVEHFADGDLFDCTLEPGWAPMTASGLAQWGPPVTKDFLGITPAARPCASCCSIVNALRDDNEFDLTRLRGLLKVASS